MQQFTKKEIKSSMLRLLQSKPLDSIKVKDIIDDIGISRNTFYYHYHDIYDVLKDIFDDTMADFNKPKPERFDWEKAFQKMSENSLIKKSIITNIFKSKYSDNINNKRAVQALNGRWTLQNTNLDIRASCRWVR